jgi:hypothetical protein
MGEPFTAQKKNGLECSLTCPSHSWQVAYFTIVRKWNGFHEWLQMPMPDFYSNGIYTHADMQQVHQGFCGLW